MQAKIPGNWKFSLPPRAARLGKSMGVLLIAFAYYFIANCQIDAFLNKKIQFITEIVLLLTLGLMVFARNKNDDENTHQLRMNALGVTGCIAFLYFTVMGILYQLGYYTRPQIVGVEQAICFLLVYWLVFFIQSRLERASMDKQDSIPFIMNKNEYNK
jgi:uncharacterized membrane protein (DUF4010 family)